MVEHIFEYTAMSALVLAGIILYSIGLWYGYQLIKLSFPMRDGKTNKPGKHRKS